jgi:hypothetical protein
MGLNRRKVEARRAETAEKEAAARRATEAQFLEDAGRLGRDPYNLLLYLVILPSDWVRPIGRS